MTISVFISYDYGDTFVDKTESFRLINSNNSNNISVDLFVTHPKFNTVSLAGEALRTAANSEHYDIHSMLLCVL